MTQGIAQGLEETRNSKKEVRRYMTLQSVIDEKVEIAKQEGMEKGMSKGLAQGKTIERANFICAMFKDGLSIEQIARISNISVVKVKKIIVSKTRN